MLHVSNDTATKDLFDRITSYSPANASHNSNFLAARGNVRNYTESSLICYRSSVADCGKQVHMVTTSTKVLEETADAVILPRATRALVVQLRRLLLAYGLPVTFPPLSLSFSFAWYLRANHENTLPTCVMHLTAGGDYSRRYAPWSSETHEKSYWIMFFWQPFFGRCKLLTLYIGGLPKYKLNAHWMTNRKSTVQAHEFIHFGRNVLGSLGISMHLLCLIRFRRVFLKLECRHGTPVPFFRRES